MKIHRCSVLPVLHLHHDNVEHISQVKEILLPFAEKKKTRKYNNTETAA